jgi:hypothetical protein
VRPDNGSSPLPSMPSKGCQAHQPLPSSNTGCKTMQVSGEEQLTNNKLRDIQHPILKSYRTNISEDPTGVFHLALSDRANKCYHDSG